MVIGLIKLLIFTIVCIYFSQVNLNCSFFFSDYGIFVMKNVEYFVYSKIDEIPNPLDIGKCNNQLIVDLYCYNWMKLLDGYESFSEKKSRLNRKDVISK